MSDSLEQDYAKHFVRPDLGPNCLQRLAADDTSRHRVNVDVVFRKLNYVCPCADPESFVRGCPIFFFS